MPVSEPEGQVTVERPESPAPSALLTLVKPRQWPAHWPLTLMLVLLSGIGPMLTWRRITPGALRRAPRVLAEDAAPAPPDPHTTGHTLPLHAALPI